MPCIVDYSTVLEQMLSQGMICHYHNSGAFGFAQEAQALAWIGPEDPTIRPAARELARQVVPPYPATLAAMAARAWTTHLAGRAWVMPMSHWAFELGDASRAWLPTLLQNIGIDAALLAERNNAAAIEFAPEETGMFEQFVKGLLENLRGSDFTLAFPGQPALCTVHHHQQLWWMTTEAKLRDALGAMASV